MVIFISQCEKNALKKSEKSNICTNFLGGAKSTTSYQTLNLGFFV